MEDSDNILSILNFLQGQGQGQGAAPTNVLQQAAPQQAAPQAPPPPPPAPEAILQAATAASPPAPKRRISLVDVIGHLADGIAQAGGATPMYQRTLDAEQKRALDLQDHGLAVTSATIKNATDKFALDTSERTRIANALGAVNDSEDAAMWPQIAEAAGLDPQRAAAIGKIVQANPDAAKVLASALGGGNDDENKLGKNLFFGTDEAGKTVAYQIGPDGHAHILDFGGKVTPSEPIKVVNTGGSNVVIGQGGGIKKILPNSASPNTVLTTTTSRQNNQDTNRTNLTIAGMPARAKDGTTAGGKASDPRAGLQIISDIQQSFDKLHGLNALPGEGGAVGNAIGSLGRTALGQTIGAKTGLSDAAQEREILSKNLANLQSDLIKSLPGNATRTRFEQEIQKRRLPDPTTMNYATANRAIGQIRQAYLVALQSQSVPKKAAPANNGWTVVGVK